MSEKDAIVAVMLLVPLCLSAAAMGQFVACNDFKTPTPKWAIWSGPICTMMIIVIFTWRALQD